MYHGSSSSLLVISDDYDCRRYQRLSIKASPAPTFPDVEQQDIPQWEFQWWYNISHQTFEKAGVVGEFSDFSAFFSELYIHFGTAEPCFVYADVVSS